MINLAHLTNRVIVSFKGKQVYDILQGITTNDIRKLQQSQSTLFLSTNGRVISEAIIHKPHIQNNGEWISCQDELWLDIDKNSKQPLLTHIKKFLIRKKIEIFDYSDQLQVFQLYNNELQHQESEGQGMQNNEIGEENDYMNLTTIDPRSSCLGVRMITNEKMDFDTKQFIEQDNEHFDLYRLSEGIFEGQEVENKIPYLMNFDFWHTINLTKGCYVGQELTARSYHTGVIRKRMIPFKILNNNNAINIRDQVIYDGDKEIGKVVMNHQNFGVASVNYLEINLDTEFKVNNMKIKFEIKDKLKQKLIEYIELIQQRQQQQ